MALELREKAKDSAPTLPTNIEITSTTLLASLKFDVIPVDKPTVAKAETHSYAIWLNGIVGSVKEIIVMVVSTNRPEKTTTANAL